jgi:hypothetical protein
MPSSEFSAISASSAVNKLSSEKGNQPALGNRPIAAAEVGIAGDFRHFRPRLSRH